MKHWTQHCLQGGAEWLNHLQVPLDHPDCAGHWKGKCWGDSVLWWWEERRQSCRWCRCIDTIYMHIYVLWTGHVPSVHPKWYWYVICTCSPSHPTIYIYIYFLYSSIRHHFSKVFPEWIIVLLHAVICQRLNQSNVLRFCSLCTVDPFYKFNYYVSLWSFQRLPWRVVGLRVQSSPEGVKFSQVFLKVRQAEKPEWDQKIQALNLLAYHQCLGFLPERHLIVAGSHISASTS